MRPSLRALVVLIAFGFGCVFTSRPQLPDNETDDNNRTTFTGHADASVDAAGGTTIPTTGTDGGASDARTARDASASDHPQERCDDPDDAGDGGDASATDDADDADADDVDDASVPVRCDAREGDLTASLPAQ